MGDSRSSTYFGSTITTGDDTVDVQVPSNESYTLKLGDNAGATKWSLLDSDSVEVASIDSNGVTSFSGGSFLADNVYLGLGNTSAAPDVRLGWNTAQTVDALYLGLSDAQNTFIIAENGDRAYDFGHGAQTNPTLFIQSASQSGTEFSKLTAGGLSFGLGLAVAATEYSVGRDADATNQLHFNVPTSAGYEFSINDVSKAVLNTTFLNLFSSAYSLGYRTEALGITYANLTAPADTKIYNICLEDDKNFDWVNFAPGGLPTFYGPIQVIHSDNQVRNEFVFWGFVSAAKVWSLQGWHGDDVDGTTKAEQGIDLHFQTGQGGSLAPGARGGNFTIETGKAQVGDNNGGDIVFDLGDGFGTGRRGILSALSDVRFDVPIGSTFSLSINDVTQTIGVLGGWRYNTGAAITGTAYEVLRDADGTNQLHFNVPTGAGFEWSINDTARMTMDATSMTRSQAAGTTGTPTMLTMTGGAHTGITAATECIGVNYNFSATKTWVSGAGPLATQREVILQAPTYAGNAGGALTMTDAYTFYVSGPPIAGSNMTLTRAWAAGFGGNIGVGAGTVSLPSLSFVGDPDSGLYSQGANVVDMAVNGGVATRTSAGLFQCAHFRALSATSTLITGLIDDGASAIGVKLGNANALTTAGAKIVSFYSDNVSTEKAYVDKDGGIYAGGMFLGKQGTDIASANNATLTKNGNYFDVTGAIQINTLSVPAGVTTGTVITIQFDGAPTVKHATAGSGAQFQLAAASDFSATAGDTLTVVYDGTYWREISRTAI